MEELIYASASTMGEAVRRKVISVVELVEMHLERIELINPQLNAVVHLAAERALTEASEADRAVQEGGSLGPLHGIPITIKDSFDVAGLVSSAGTMGRKDFVPEQDATPVARLRASGAIVLGMTNTPELTMASETDNLLYGRTNNPYDLTKSPGASSGGAAAIVAAGGSAFDIGSDSGGSIRAPAHYCGIAGIRPTTGRVPRTGHIISFDTGPLDPLMQIGPLARDAADLALILKAIVGPDCVDPAILDVPLEEATAIDLAELRVATYVDSDADDSVAEIVAVAAEALASKGAEVREDRPPDIERSADIWSDLIAADAGAATRALLEQAGTLSHHSCLDWQFEARPLTAAEFGALLREWDHFRSDLTQHFCDYDLIVCPAAPTAAKPHGTLSRSDYGPTMTYNLTGWPAVVLRCGSTGDGLPIGVQLVAKPYREDVALAAALCLQETFGGYQPPRL